MIVDTSALIAILLNEHDSTQLFDALFATPSRYIGAPTLVEAGMVAKSVKGSGALPRLEQLLRDLQIEILPFGAGHAHVAKTAFAVYGKGQGHPAQLNFGDCMSYAIAKVEAMPLLFKGDDFRLTDVEAAL